MSIFCTVSCNTEQKKASSADDGRFIKVSGTKFMLEGKPYFYMGTNFWYGMNLGSIGEGGNRERLLRELDRLQKAGITNLRIMAMSEGPDDQPYRMSPAVQDDQGIKTELLEGLDFLLNEMAERKMYAVVCLSNFWPWSGGFAQYVSWNTKDSIPYPPPHPNGSWDGYQQYAARFYTIPKARQKYADAVKQIVGRTNTVSNLPYNNDPTIMAWELCNEPRGLSLMEQYLNWIDSTSAMIRQMAPKQLITVGSEGETGSLEYSGTDFEKTHSFKNIDYTTVHIWIQNWDWYNPLKHDQTFPEAGKKALSYLHKHAEQAKKLNKPYVLEEFGIMKDGGSFNPDTTAKNRDKFYTLMFEEVYTMAKKSEASGVNFWAWAGEGRPRTNKGWWKRGDDFTGDPPHEEQGWYSVYEKDSSTLNVIKKYADLMSRLR